MRHNVQISLSIESFAEPDLQVRQAAHNAGLPTPNGPMVAKKQITFASWGNQLPDAAMPALEAAADFIQGTGVAVIPKDTLSEKQH